MKYLKLSILLCFLAILIGYLYKSWVSGSLPVRVSGFVDPRFKHVEEVFRKNFESGRETGAAFAVYYKGDLVVDLWGGYVNKEGQIPWREDTMSIAYSTSKGINALLIAKFVELGYLDYKKTVSHYWPEFSQNGKENITVETLISHQAGLIGFDQPISIRLMKSDYESYTSLLAAQKPFWEPGTKLGYHMLSWGYYVDVLLTKADPKKRMVDQIFKEEIAEPFGNYIRHSMKEKDFWKRIKYSIFDEHGYQSTAEQACKDFMVDNAIEAATDYEFRSIPLSSFNGYGTARAIAKLYGIVSNGGVYDDKTLLTQSTLDTLEEVVVQAKDVVIGSDIRMGRGLMIIDSPLGSPMIGHPGFGGQMGIADLKNNLGIGYLTNNLAAFSLIGQPYTSVNDALYKCLKQIQDG